MTTLQTVRNARLTTGTLARFAPGLTWDEVLPLGGHSAGWWRMAVAEAEGRSLLIWSRASERWILTPAGRAVTRGVS